MATTATLTSATEAYSVQAQLAAAAVVAAQRLRKPSPAQIAALVAAYQLLAAQQGAAAVPAMLAEQGLSAATTAAVATQALAGLTSAGYPLSTMFETIQSPAQLAMLVASAVQDAGRNGASLRMTVTPSVTGYVRMLNPPSCSRCVILAGKFYRWNEGFERHPNCDCRHIPSTEALAGDLTTDPQAYFDSLSRAEQDRTFTAAGAEAIRDGADMGRVVNARRNGGVRTALRGRRGARPMPEHIYAMAADRADAIRLLKLAGFIF